MNIHPPPPIIVLGTALPSPHYIIATIATAASLSQLLLLHIYCTCTILQILFFRAILLLLKQPLYITNIIGLLPPPPLPASPPSPPLPHYLNCYCCIYIVLVLSCKFYFFRAILLILKQPLYITNSIGLLPPPPLPPLPPLPHYLNCYCCIYIVLVLSCKFYFFRAIFN